jgi:hypothetical protein
MDMFIPYRGPGSHPLPFSRGELLDSVFAKPLMFSGGAMIEPAGKCSKDDG